MKFPKISLHWQILIALVLGLFYGIFLPSHVQWVEWMGVIFLRALQMIIIPLILTSIITGITQINSGRRLGTLGLKTLTYYITTSIIAILTGMVLVNIFRPGARSRPWFYPGGRRIGY